MQRILARLLVAALFASLVSCTGDGPTYTWLRTMHVVPDAPNLNASFDDFVFRENMPFGTTTDNRLQSLLDRNNGIAPMTLEYFGPNGRIAGTLLTLDVPVEKDTVSTVIMAGSFDAIEPVVVLTPRRERPLDRLYFQFAHAAPGQEALDVYVTAPEVELSATAPLATVQPLAHTESLEVPFGSLRLRLTRAGTLDVVMDSGELAFEPDTQTTTGPGAEWLFAIAPSVAAGPSPYFMLASSGRSSVSLFDADTPAVLRAVHAAAGIGAANLETLTEPTEVLYPDLAFGQRSPRVPAPAGTFALGFRAVAAPDEPVASVTASTVRGTEYLAALVGDSTTARVRLEASPARSVASEARLRFAYLSIEGALVAAHLTQSEDEPLSTGNRFLFNRPAGEITGYLSLAAGDYFLTLTTRPADDPANDADPVLLGPLPLGLVNGDVFTLALFPPAGEGESTTLQVLDDLAP